ncbi:uncharacterized protein N7482_007695 [Penicillium canariense]|uniref:Uncharacterized protein n=1 Tax=Penicillium canariense TaxID=189055 RepID=A0A9W9HZJ8_9EURO|nr:uncharacterized protein N7482_007695 [Penicillium canariense]KAJ5160691.1 hypothetical protein N7482_007695 [Penicillium canariense]
MNSGPTFTTISSQSLEHMRILIMGGLRGLAAAVPLLRTATCSIEYSLIQPFLSSKLSVSMVFNKRASPSLKGGGLVIRPNAFRSLQSRGLGDAIEQFADRRLPFEIHDLKKENQKTRKRPQALRKKMQDIY